jgi:coenzyme Q-binding protein COQ10
MPRHEEQRTLAYTADELFSVVADVKDYPSFVPWCTGARIHRESEQEIVAELEIGFGPFRESFTSQVTLDRPRQVLVRATEGGPLERLTNTWTFTPEGERTQVDLVVDFEFKSRLLDHAASTMFHEAATRTMAAFESRMHLVHAIAQRQRQHPSS